MRTIGLFLVVCCVAACNGKVDSGTFSTTNGKPGVWASCSKHGECLRAIGLECKNGYTITNESLFGGYIEAECK